MSNVGVTGTASGAVGAANGLGAGVSIAPVIKNTKKGCNPIKKGQTDLSNVGVTGTASGAVGAVNGLGAGVSIAPVVKNIKKGSNPIKKGQKDLSDIGASGAVGAANGSSVPVSLTSGTQSTKRKGKPRNKNQKKDLSHVGVTCTASGAGPPGNSGPPTNFSPEPPSTEIVSDIDNGPSASGNSGASRVYLTTPGSILEALDNFENSPPLSPLDENLLDMGWDVDSAGEEPGQSDGESIEDPEDPLEDLEDDDIGNDSSSPDSINWQDVNCFYPHLCCSPFDNRPSGITEEFPVGENGKEIDFWEALLSDDILNKIVMETNKYVDYVKANRQIYLNSRIHRWKPTNISELKVFFALLFLMPLNKKHLLSDYWKNDPLIGTPLWGKYMTRDRFLLLLSMLHFADNNYPSDLDRLWKVREVFEMFTANYKRYFVPFQKLVIDESLVLFKGRLVWKQYIPSKRHRFGIKIFVLCDCETGIILAMIVYTGTNIDYPTNDQLGISGAIVKKMTETYMDKGHILYTDNWYSSPSLCRYLLSRKTGAVGTVKTNRKYFPKFPDTERGVVNLKRSECGKILALSWKDKRPVNMVSTVNLGEMKDSGKRNHLTQEVIMKPDVVLDYNQNMRLVDKSDCQLSAVECVRQSSKWYHKFMFHILDVNNLNAYNFFLVKTGRKEVKFREFIYNLVNQILKKYGILTTNVRGRRPMDHPDRASAIGFSSRHYLENLPMMDFPSGRRREQRPCHVCRHTKKRQTRVKKVGTICHECKVPLCIGTCWRDYHSVSNLDNL